MLCSLSVEAVRDVSVFKKAHTAAVDVEAVPAVATATSSSAAAPPPPSPPKAPTAVEVIVIIEAVVVVVVVTVPLITRVTEGVVAVATGEVTNCKE